MTKKSAVNQSFVVQEEALVRLAKAVGIEEIPLMGLTPIVEANERLALIYNTAADRLEKLGE